MSNVLPVLKRRRSTRQSNNVLQMTSVRLRVLPRLMCEQAAKSVGCRKPTKFIQDPSPQKIAEEFL